MTKFLNNINLEAENDIQFKTAAGANAGKISQTGDDLVISNAVGDILLGNGSDDIYIGDGTNTVDIRFEQNMAIFADSGSTRTLTLGGANTNLVLESPVISGTLSLGATTISNKLTFTGSSGYILFDYEPSGDTGEYTTEVPLLKVDVNGSESTILSRVSEYRAVVLGADDTVHIAAGDTKTVIKDNLNLTAEVVLMSAESGFHAYGFPNNDTSWANRNEFRFRTESTTASENGLYIGDGGNTQFIDLSRNLVNIGTIGSGDITTSGNIYLNNNKSIFGKNTSGSNYGLLTITSGNIVKLGAYSYTSAATEIGLGDNGKFLIGTAEALSIDNSKNATFAGTGEFEGNVIINTPSLNSDSQGLTINRPAAGTHYASVEFATNGTVDWSVGTNSTDAFEVYENGSASTTRLSIAEGGNATFAGTVTAGGTTLTGDQDLSSYLTSYTVSESDVTTHQAALSITESQISDLQSYTTGAHPTDFVSAASGGTFGGNVTVGANSLTAGNLVLPAADDITFTNTTDKHYKMSNTETRINAMPFGGDWHDTLAFGRNYTISQEISLNGSSFSSTTLEPEVFDLRTDNAITVIDGTISTEEQAVRYTFTNVAYVSAQFLKICFSYASPAPSIVVTIDTSNDGFSSNSTQRHQSTFTNASATTGYFYLDSFGGDAHMRVTLDKGNNTDGRRCGVSSIQLLTRRHGDQGQGGEYMMPFDWNYDRDITLLGKLNVNADGFALDGNIITGIDDSGEFTNDDAHIMTSAAIEDKIADNDNNFLTSETSHSDVLVDGEFTGQGFMVRGASSGTYSIDTNTYITSQRAISSTPSDGATTTAISSDWAFDNVKTAVPTNAVFTDTVNTLVIGNGSNEAMAGDTSIPSISGLATETYVDDAESDAISAAATAGDARYNLVSGNLFVDSKKVMDLPSNSTQRGPFQPLAAMIRGAGTAVYGDEDFNAGENSVNVYNNSSGTGVAKTRETDQTTLNQVAPNSSGYVIKFVNNGNSTSPGRGGFYQTISSSNNKTFVQVFQAKIPATYSVVHAENPQGSNNTSYWLTSQEGTGKFEWYVRVSHCGDSGSFSSGGHVYLNGGSAGDQFTWYLASSEIYNVTDAQAKKLRNLSVTNDLTVGGDITVTGDLTLSGAPTNNSHAATKAYVDGAVIANTDTQDLTISGRTISLTNSPSVTVPAPTYASVTGKPATFAPIIGTTSATAMAGNTDIPSGNQILDWTASQGGETKIHSDNITFPTMYTHPSYATTNINTSGSTIIDSITTNGTGHITAMGTRTLALSDLGFSGHSAADCVLNASQTLTNKVIDADNNTISDLVVSNLKASAVVLESEGIGSNDNDTTIPTSAAVKDYVDSAVIADTDTQDLGISGNSVTLDRGGSADISTITAVANNTAKTSFPGFGTSNTTALRGDTSIPSISGLASTSYVDTAEADAITAAASAAAGLYVPNTGTTTIGGTKTFTGSLILNDSSGSSPTMRFMNTTSPTEDEVSIFCNTSGKMKFQQKLASVGSNVVQMTMDENGLHVDNGLKVGTGATVTTILDEDAMGSNSATALATQQSIKAYVTSSVAGAGGGTMSNWLLASPGTSGTETIDQGDTVTFAGGTGITTSRSGLQINIVNSAPAGSSHLNSNVTLGTLGAQASGNYITGTGSLSTQDLTDIGNLSGNNSGDVCTTNHTGAGYLTSVADNSITLAKMDGLTRGSIIVGDSNGDPSELTVGSDNHVLTVDSNGDIGWEAASGGGGSSLPSDPGGYGILVWDDTANAAKWASAGTMLSITSNGSSVNSSANNYSHPTGAGNKHIPSGGSTGKFLKYSSSGTATWATPSYISNTNTQRAAGNGMALDNNEMDLDIDGQTAVTSARRDTMFIIDDPNDTGANALKKLSLYNMMEDMTDGAQSYTGSLTTGTSSPGQANSRFNLSVKCDTSNGAIQTSSSGLQVKVRGDIGINANGLGLNADLTVVDTIYNAALHVGYASNAMHCDYSAATSTGEIRWYRGTVEVMALGYEGNLEVLDDVTADSQVLTSDRKLKKNIEPLNYGLNEVLKLKPVRYEWKESYKKGKGTMVGFVSQDVQEVIPEVINESKIIGTEETKLGIDYSKIVAVLTNAIQEQQKQIDELKKIVYGNTN